MSTYISNAVDGEVKEQGRLFRFKDTLTLVLVAIVWVAAFVTTYLTGLPEEVAVGIGAAGNVAAVIVTRLTPGAITPSMAKRLESRANKQAVPAPAPIPAPLRNTPAGNYLDDLRSRLADRS